MNSFSNAFVKKITKPSKYKAVKASADGISFASKAERDYYLELRLLEKVTSARTQLIELQPKIVLSKANITYRPDFLIMENEQLIYIDVKGMQTPVFNLKARLWRAYTSDVLRIIKRKGKVFVIDKEIKGELKL